MKIAILTNEYPPHVYGGAGVHVEYLTKELIAAENHAHNIEVFCFADQHVTPLPTADARHAKLFDTLQKDLSMAAKAGNIDVVHCHTWYSHFAGLLVKQLHGVPLVLTTHSLEPHRPWKAEQLGTAYQTSSWIEKTAYQNADGVIAVSQSMKRDVQELYGVPEEKIRVIHNGIDLNQYKPVMDTAVLDKYGINKNIPYILFVGRITRQKGIVHLVNAIKYFNPGYQIVLCAGAPDTEEIALQMKEEVARARTQTNNQIHWLTQSLSKDDIIALYSQALLFVCPSVYEPFGIINLEAMACETPVVASAVGGIPEVVVHGETGLLVSIDDLEKFPYNLAQAVNSLLDSPEKIKEMALNSRRRVEEHFSWQSIAIKTLEFYSQLIEKRGEKADV